MLDNATVYLFFRQDLPLKMQMHQSNHATFQLAEKRMPEGGVPALIAIGLPDTKAVNKVLQKLQDAVIFYEAYVDPDMPQNGVTALMTEPLIGARREPLANYRLWNENNNTQWVKQEHTNGCVLASLAMVLGKTYKAVHDELAPLIWWYNSDTSQWNQGCDFSKHGITGDDIYRYLERNGYATQTRYRYEWGKVEVAEWPPKPFAPVHMCMVTTPSDTVHEIVMTSDGRLLDPNRPPGTWSGDWSFYKQVFHVIGVWYVGSSKLSATASPST